MPLNGESSVFLHILQNASLIALSVFFFPLVTFIAVTNQLISPYTASTKHIKHQRRWRAASSASFRPRTVLVTGVGMSKGLAIARSFYRGGHTVIGADFEPAGIPVCGHSSASLKRFYTLAKPTPGSSGAMKYTEELIGIIKKEKVELWVSCSGVASAVEDGEAAEAVERVTKCKAIQFNVEVTSTLHEKHAFIENTRSLGLNVPETHHITSSAAAISILSSTPKNKRFILKSIGLDDTIRADMTLLPLSSPSDTRAYITCLSPSIDRPFVLQQFIKGKEYCTHAVLINNVLKTFTCCPSSELLMHYSSLSPTSTLYLAMKEYTTIYAREMRKRGKVMTGHFSIDFLIEDDDVDLGEKELLARLWPIECNPRAHTAVVLLSSEGEAMADSYLDILPDHDSKILTNGREILGVITQKEHERYYWVGHDIVALGILPVLDLLRGKVGIAGLLEKWMEFAKHLLYWKDGTWEIWDPWPFWWLYVVYWPGMFARALLTRSWWSRVNVSTTKMFSC
jgi:catechol O-methyltransferase